MTVRRHVSLFVPAIAILSPAPVAAQEKPYIEVDMTVFTGRNPFLIPGDTEITSGGQIGAEGRATVGVDYRTALELDGALAYRRYTRRFGTFVTGHAGAALEHRNSERLSLRTEAIYDRSLPLEMAVASIDAAIDPVSLQERYAIEQDIRWTPDRFTRIIGNVALTRISPRGSLVLTQTDAATLTASIERRVATTTWLGIEGQVTRSEARDGGVARAGSIGLKGGFRFARNFSADITAGLSKTSRSGPRGPGPDRPGEDGSGQFAARASLCYDPRRFRLCLSGAVSPVVTSFDGIRREKALNATFDLRTMPHANFHLEADYRAMPARAIPGTDRLADPKVMRAAARYEHQLDSRLTLNIGADYDRRTGLARQTLDAWTVRVGATFRIPRL